MQTHFILLANIRTGSTLLASLLNAHPDICCDGERFADASFSAEAAHQHLQQRIAQTTTAAYGFIFRLGQIHDASQSLSHHFLNTLVANGWRILFLRRENLMRQALSRLVAQQHATWHISERTALPAIPIDCTKLLATMRRFEISNALYAQWTRAVPHTALVYEHDLRDAHHHQATVNRICKTLSLPNKRVTTKLTRSTAPHLRDVVTNYDEVVACLAGTRYAVYL